MQSNPRTPARKPSKFLDAKIMIAALSAAVTVGFWNLFAGQALAMDDPNAKQPPAQPPEDSLLQVQADPAADGLPPVPTLVPLMNLSGAAPLAGGQSAPLAGNTAPAQGGPSAALRQVAVPTVVVVQKNKPLIDSPVVTVQGGGGGRSRGQRPAASTRSSR